MFLLLHLPGQRCFHRLHQILRIMCHDHPASLRQSPSKLHLMIVHMFAKNRAARHDNRCFAGPNRMDQRTRTGMHDKHLGVVELPDEIIHAQKSHELALAFERGGMAVLDDDWLWQPCRYPADTLQKAGK